MIKWSNERHTGMKGEALVNNYRFRPNMVDDDSYFKKNKTKKRL